MFSKNANVKIYLMIIGCLLILGIAFSLGKEKPALSEYPGGLLKIYIEKDGDHLSKDDGYLVCELEFGDKYGHEIYDDEGLIRVRGNSTAIGRKEPYDIRFSAKENLLGFGLNKKWRLLAECFDPTLLRNKIFFDLAAKMELPYTPQNEFVELYMNNKYEGPYLLVENLTAGKDKIDIHPQFGDFLFEYESYREDEGEIYIVTDHGLRFLINDIENPEQKRLKEIEDSLNRFDITLYSGDFEQLKKTVDIDSFSKFYLLNEYAKSVDFTFSSVKFFQKDDIVYAGPVWDYDLSSGNYDLDFYYYMYEGENEEERAEKLISYSGFYCAENPIFGRLLDYPEFRESVRKNYQKYKRDFEYIYQKDGMIDLYLEKYGDMFKLNYTSEEEGGAGWVLNERQSANEFERFATYEENLDYLKTWLKKRNEWINDNNNWDQRTFVEKLIDLWGYAIIFEKE